MPVKKIIPICLFLVVFFAVCSLSYGAPLMVDKNLFAQDRKPPSPESSASPAQPARMSMPITNFQLDGVIILGDTKKALIRMKSPGAGADKKKFQSPYVTVKEGQQVGDYRVTKIEAKSVSLEKDGQTYMLNLFAEGKVAPPVTAPPPVAMTPEQPGVPGNTPPNILPSGNSPGAIPPNMRQRGQRMQPGQEPQQLSPNPGTPAFADPNFTQHAPSEPPMPGQQGEQAGGEEEEESN